MKIIKNYKNCPIPAKGSVLAIGNFDGVHKGHLAILEKTKETAKIEGSVPSVLTFEPHPLSILNPNIKPFRLTSEEQKAALMEESGIKNLFTINFDKEFSQIKAEDFIKEILVDELAVKHVITGEDFIFGHNREGNPSILAKAALKYGFSYTNLKPVGNDNIIYSSSAIRRSLIEGKLSEVKSILGRNFVICGTVIEGNKQGRTIDFPTINIALRDYIRPAFGVYAVKIYLEGRAEALLGAANIGISPTINGSNELLEAHIFDFSENIYRHKVSVELIEYIRPEQKFSNLEELKSQISKDCDKARNILA
jgi:riboflavin kinase / FMN adenylyltransferase